MGLHQAHSQTHETTLDAPPLFVIAGDSLVFAVNVKVVLFASHGASVSMDAKSGSNFGINVPSIFATITG